MKRNTLILLTALALGLCGCNEKEVVTYQPIMVQNNIETASAKPTQTKIKDNTKQTAEINTVTKSTEDNKTENSVKSEVKENQNTTEKKNNSIQTTVKDVIIDGTGSLVFAKADGTFLSFAPVQGPVGPQGAPGSPGERGADGRGIEYCELNSKKELIIHYTDGTSQNVGSVAVSSGSGDDEGSSEDKPDYEKVGYVVETGSDIGETQHLENDAGSYDIVFESISIKLSSVNNSNPSKKYHYTGQYTYTVTNYTQTGVGEMVATAGVNFDNSHYQDGKQGNIISGDESSKHNYVDFYSSIPYVSVASHPQIFNY